MIDMEIIRNCSHYSSTQTALVLDDRARPVSIIKTAFTEEGVRSLIRERDGITWYEKRLGMAPHAVISSDNHNNTFSRLELAYKDGCLGNISRSVSENYNKIHNALTHYLDIFRKDGDRFNHGDYSIDNILFRNNDVVWILDWDKFNDKLPREFDIVYCVVEACYFCYKRRKVLSRGDVDKAIDLLKYGVKNLDMPYDQIIKAPANYVRKLFLDNKSVFGRQFMKYPLVNCRDEDILAIDTVFSKKVS